MCSTSVAVFANALTQPGILLNGPAAFFKAAVNRVFRLRLLLIEVRSPLSLLCLVRISVNDGDDPLE